MSGKKRILLIEDSPESTVLIQSWLGGDTESELFCAADGTTGANLIRSGDWDLVICDLNLPGADGIDILPLVRSSAPWTQVLVITGEKNFDNAVKVVALADKMLLKPFKREDFLAAVTQLLFEARAKRQRRRRCVLAIGAHPDDVEIGCGGTLARYAAEGAINVILVLSKGAHGGEADQRELEAKKGAEQLGAECFVFNLPDRQIEIGHTTIEVIESVLSRYEVTHVYTHSAKDRHQDHRNVHAASLVATRSIGNVFCYQAPSATVDFAPNLFVDIGPFLETKLRAINAHVSQASSRTYLNSELIRATALYWSRFSSSSFVEPFEAVRSSG